MARAIGTPAQAGNTPVDGRSPRSHTMNTMVALLTCFGKLQRHMRRSGG